VIALIGTPTPESTRMVALTLTEGDPTWAGPLAGVRLGVPVFHVAEPTVKALVAAEVWDREVGLAEHALDTAAIITELQGVRTNRA
jgi:glycine/sarcosine/betaine reductase complex component A